MGKGNISCIMFRLCEGSALTRSVVTLNSARPAGMNSVGWIVFPWNFTTAFFRLSCRRTCKKLNARADPELSPVITMFVAGMASCGELGGGARSEI